MKKVVVVVVVLMVAALATTAQAVLINSFVNADFDSGIVTTPGPFAGFDAPAAPEIIGWSNYIDDHDAGVEAAGAWWLAGYTNQNCAFVNPSGGATNKSSYVIQDGDQFTVSFIADSWWNGATARVSLWYDDPANVIGSFDSVTNQWHYDPYSNATPIAATSTSVGGTLGITVYNLGAGTLTWDEVTVDVVPEPATLTMLVFAGAFGLVYRRIRKK
jgi:hypothetical protein